MQAFRVGTNLGGVAVDTATRLVALANETVSSITD
jgi:hypothetical protein